MQERQQKGSVAWILNSASAHNASNTSQPFDVDLEPRSTIALERKFVNLDPADMDYLRSKGQSDRAIPLNVL